MGGNEGERRRRGNGGAEARQVADAREAMGELIARVPRDLGHADEPAHLFRAAAER